MPREGRSLQYPVAVSGVRGTAADATTSRAGQRTFTRSSGARQPLEDRARSSVSLAGGDGSRALVRARAGARVPVRWLRPARRHARRARGGARAARHRLRARAGRAPGARAATGGRGARRVRSRVRARGRQERLPRRSRSEASRAAGRRLAHARGGGRGDPLDSRAAPEPVRERGRGDEPRLRTAAAARRLRCALALRAGADPLHAADAQPAARLGVAERLCRGGRADRARAVEAAARAGRALQPARAPRTRVRGPRDPGAVDPRRRCGRSARGHALPVVAGGRRERRRHHADHRHRRLRLSRLLETCATSSPASSSAACGAPPDTTR